MYADKNRFQKQLHRKNPLKYTYHQPQKQSNTKHTQHNDTNNNCGTKHNRPKGKRLGTPYSIVAHDNVWQEKTSEFVTMQDKKKFWFLNGDQDCTEQPIRALY